MLYIYMHNYRGFSNTLIPLAQVNFLAGENSTGKSSLLKLLYLFSVREFYFSPNFMPHGDAEFFGGFRDIVSAWADDKSFFQVGIIRGRKEEEGNSINSTFSLFNFSEKDGAPSLSRYTYFSKNKLSIVKFSEREISYKISKIKGEFLSEKDITNFFLKTATSDRKNNRGFRKFPEIFTDSGMPLPVAMSILQSIEKGKDISPDGPLSFAFSRLGYLDITWLDPIRAKPKRFYDSLPRSFSPEGEHTPLVLRRILEGGEKSMRFVHKLKNFGSSSGLFETVTTHSFGNDPQSPFELLIKFSGVQLNVNNVGYGVSQVLPLIVEFLVEERQKVFIVQQPEIHLHPRAQAALGTFIYDLAKEQEHSFFLETHSDHLIDRYRLLMNSDENTPITQTLFFQRVENGNKIHLIPITSKGQYPQDQPAEFREFFIKEAMELLEI